MRPATGYAARATAKPAAQPIIRSVFMLLLLETDQVDGDRQLVADLRHGGLRNLDAELGELELEARREAQAGRLAPVGLLDEREGDLPDGHLHGDRLLHAVHRELALDGPGLVILLCRLGRLELDRLELGGIEPILAAQVLVPERD